MRMERSPLENLLKSIQSFNPKRIRDFIDRAHEAYETYFFGKLYWKTWGKYSGKRSFVLKEIMPKVWLKLYFDSELCKLIYFDIFEQSECNFVKSYLKPGDIFFDIGSNIGLYTVIASSMVGRRGRVYAFEPCTKTFHRLQENIKLNHIENAHCFQNALSDNENPLELNISLDGHDAWNSFARPIAGASFAKETVQAVTLDSFCKEHDLAGRITMIKIDVEGWETRVLAGGRDVLSRADAPTLMVEFTDEAAASANSSCVTLYEDLQALGYTLFSYDGAQNTLIHHPLVDTYPYLNLIATKHPESVNARLKYNEKSS